MNKKTLLKLELKEGRLTQRDYQDKLKELKRYIKGEKEKIESIWKSFLMDNFKVEIPLGDIEKYLQTAYD